MSLPFQPANSTTGNDGIEQSFTFSMAFQPIVDVVTERVFAYEALVRGLHNESADSVLAQVTPENRYAFDQSCRAKAITLAGRLRLAERGAKLSINCMPGAVYSPAACIQSTLNMAKRVGFPQDRLIFEVTQMERARDSGQLLAVVEEYRRHGFQIALDDFGGGYAGLNLLADMTADIVKLDTELTRNLHQRPAALAIVRTIVHLCTTLGIGVVAKGVETREEYDVLRGCGVRLMQGHLLAKPAFEALPSFGLPDRARTMATYPLPRYDAFAVQPN